jgi:hypothetical protein
MPRRIDAEVAVKVTGQDKVDKLEKQLDELSGEKVEIPIEADDQATRDIDDLMAKVDKLGGEPAQILLASNAAQITNEIADLIIDIDKLDSSDPTIDMKIERVGQLTGDLDKIQAKVKEIDGMRVSPQIDTTPAVGGIDRISDSARGANSALANMIGNAGQDVGALGGIAGSAGVAIGQMAEYAADATLGGERLGSALKSMVAVAGPIAVLAAALQAVTGAMAESKAEAEAARKLTEDLGTAMRETGDDAVGLANAIRENIPALRDWTTESLLGTGILGEMAVEANRLGKNIPILGKLFQDLGVDVVGAMNDAGLSIFQFGDAVQGSDADFQAFLQLLDDFKLAGLITSDQYKGLTDAANSYRDSVLDAKEAQKLFNVNQAEANSLFKEFLTQEAPLESFTSHWKTLMDDMRDGSIDSKAAADAINFLTDALGKQPEEIIAIAQAGLDDEYAAQAKAADEAKRAVDENNEKMREAYAAQRQFADAVGLANAGLAEAVDSADAMGTALDRLNTTTSELDFSQMALDTVGSFDDMKTAIDAAAEAGVDLSKIDLTPESVEELKNIPAELAGIVDAVAGMREPIQTELTHAFDTGGVDAFVEKARFFRREVVTQFTQSLMDAGVSAEEAQAQARQLADELGLMPRDVRIAIRLTREEEARAALAAFSSVIADLPEEQQIRINTAIAEGDIARALEILNTQLILRGYPPITLPVDADTAPAEEGIEGTRGKKRPPARIDTEVGDNKAEPELEDIRTKRRQAKIDAAKGQDTASGDLDAIQRTTNPRVAPIAAQALNVSLVDQVLASLARSRTAFITADALTETAETELNDTARDRTSYVRQVVLPPTGGAKGLTSRGETVQTGELGPELVRYPDGTWGWTGIAGPQLSYLPSGARVFPAHESREIAKRRTIVTRKMANGGVVLAERATAAAGGLTIHVHNNMRAGVIGNRFDVARAVTAATKDAIRFAGRRAVLSGQW